MTEPLATSLAAVRDAAGSCAAEIRTSAKRTEDEPDQLAARRAALASLDEVHDAAERILDAFGAEVAVRPDVVWLDQPAERDSRRPPTLRVAPLQVSGLLAEKVFGRRTVALTSATLSVGGSFVPLAHQWGLPQARPAVPVPAPAELAPADTGTSGTEPGDSETSDTGTSDTGTSGDDDARTPHPMAWSGIDVGSPFDHPRSGILYVARHLPPPGRDGLPEQYLDEIQELITAAGGRTLGLFSSMRAARQAATELRDRIDFPLLCQGEDPTSQLISRFAGDEATCLFGTLSLWQGVDVPGRSLQLVIIDRIPFPTARRPAGLGPAAGSRRARRERVHVRGRRPGRAAAGPGDRAAAAHGQRPGSGRDPRPPAGHGAVRRLPARVAAAVLDHDQPGDRPRRTPALG